MSGADRRPGGAPPGARVALESPVGWPGRASGLDGVLAAARDVVPVAGSRRAAVLHRMLLVADLSAAATGGALAGVAAGLAAGPAALLAAACAALWTAGAFVCGLYATGDLRAWVTGVPDVRWLVFVALGVSWPLTLVAAGLGAGHPSRAALLASAFSLGLAVAGRATARGVAHRSERLRERTLIVGSGRVALRVAEKLRGHDDAGLIPIGVVDDDMHDAVHLGVPCLGTLADLPDVLPRHAVDRVVIAFSRAGHEELLGAIRACRDHRIPVHVVPRLYEFLDGARELDHLGGLPLVSLGVPRLTPVSRAAKRALDLVVAGVGVVVLLPMFVVVAAAIRIESPGPVLFRQRRAGRGGSTFHLLKFRSMYDGADDRKLELVDANDLTDGVLFKMRRDPRVTRVGALLRRFSLDELPQLFNVLAGQMSLVGPRPLVLPEADALAEHWHRRRQDLRPGLTGPWQIYGRSDIPFHEMVRLDYQYVAGWSLARDFEILLATAPAVLSGRGAY